MLLGFGEMDSKLTFGKEHTWCGKHLYIILEGECPSGLPFAVEGSRGRKEPWGMSQQERGERKRNTSVGGSETGDSRWEGPREPPLGLEKGH